MSSPLDRFDRPARVDRILVIRLGALGDVLRTIPAVAGLRSRLPGAHLTWLVEPASASAVRIAGCVDEALVFPRDELERLARRGDLLAFFRTARRFLRTLRARRFACVLDFHGLAKSGLLAWLSGTPIRFGFAPPASREGAWLFANRIVTPPGARISRHRRNAALLEAFVPGAGVPQTPLLAATPAARARMAERLAELGVPDARGFVLIHPGTSERARHKRYSVAGWRAVAEMLASEGRSVWVAGGDSPSEREEKAAIVAGLPGRVFAAPETGSFDDLVALIERAGVLAAPDSGPLHAATLCGVPVVQLLGPTDPVHNLPGPASPWRRIHVAAPCSPCRRGCAAAVCMASIAPARVAEAIRTLAPRLALVAGGAGAPAPGRERS